MTATYNHPDLPALNQPSSPSTNSLPLSAMSLSTVPTTVPPNRHKNATTALDMLSTIAIARLQSLQPSPTISAAPDDIPPVPKLPSYTTLIASLLSHKPPLSPPPRLPIPPPLALPSRHNQHHNFTHLSHADSVSAHPNVPTTKLHTMPSAHIEYQPLQQLNTAHLDSCFNSNVNSSTQLVASSDYFTHSATTQISPDQDLSKIARRPSVPPHSISKSTPYPSISYFSPVTSLARTPSPALPLLTHNYNNVSQPPLRHWNNIRAPMAPPPAQPFSLNAMPAASSAVAETEVLIASVAVSPAATPPAAQEFLHYAASENSSHGSQDEAIAFMGVPPPIPPSPRGKSRTLPSHFCHICARTRKKVQLLHCSKLLTGSCRKVICQNCFIENKWDWDNAVRNANTWECTHCRHKCPSRSQCVIYKRTNKRRKEQQLRERAQRQRVENENSNISGGGRRVEHLVVAQDDDKNENVIQGARNE